LDYVEAGLWATPLASNVYKGVKPVFSKAVDNVINSDAV
jgi:hypothetical protein